MGPNQNRRKDAREHIMLNPCFWSAKTEQAILYLQHRASELFFFGALSNERFKSNSKVPVGSPKRNHPRDHTRSTGQSKITFDALGLPRARPPRKQSNPKTTKRNKTKIPERDTGTFVLRISNEIGKERSFPRPSFVFGSSGFLVRKSP